MTSRRRRLASAARPTFERWVRGRYTTGVGIGDSFMNRVGASVSANAWLDIVATRTGLTIDNRAISGTVCQNSNDASAAARADNWRDGYSAAMTGANKRSIGILAIGFNDARYVGAPSTFDVTNYQNDLDEIVSDLIATGGYTAETLVLVSPYWISDTGLNTHFGDANFSGQTREGFFAHVEACRSVAKKHRTWFGEAYARPWISGSTSLLDPDNVHYNDAGHSVVAEACLAAVRL